MEEDFGKLYSDGDLDGIVVVDFWAEWCGPCKMLEPIFEQMEEEYGEKARFARMEVDCNPELCTQYNVMGIPTVIYLKDGEERDRIVGYRPKEYFSRRLELLFDE